MLRGSQAVVVVLLFVFVPVALSQNTASSASNRDKFLGLIQTADDILAGKNLEQAKTFIRPGARLVSGARYENLLDIVSGNVKGVSLTDTSYHGIMVAGQTNDSEDMGFFVLKTRTSDTSKVRFHSIVFSKDSTGQYKINIWHAGE